MIDKIVEEALAPGNLVHGTIELSADTALAKGLRPRTNSWRHPGGESWGFNQVCFALMGRLELPWRYTTSYHYGPGKIGNKGLAVIVDLERIKNRFPTELKAVGFNFTSGYRENRGDVQNNLKDRYDFDPVTDSVFGIPIRGRHFAAGGNRYLPDEVIFEPVDPTTTIVTPDTFAAFILPEANLQSTTTFLKMFALKKVNLDRPLPLISSEKLEVLVEDIRTLK